MSNRLTRYLPRNIDTHTGSGAGAVGRFYLSSIWTAIATQSPTQDEKESSVKGAKLAASIFGDATGIDNGRIVASGEGQNCAIRKSDHMPK